MSPPSGFAPRCLARPVYENLGPPSNSPPLLTVSSFWLPGLEFFLAGTSFANSICRLGGAAIATQLEWALGHLCRLRSAALAPPWCFFLNSGHEGGNGGSEDGRGVSEARSTCTGMKGVRAEYCFFTYSGKLTVALRISPRPSQRLSLYPSLLVTKRVPVNGGICSKNHTVHLSVRLSIQPPCRKLKGILGREVYTRRTFPNC